MVLLPDASDGPDFLITPQPIPVCMNGCFDRSLRGPVQVVHGNKYAREKFAECKSFMYAWMSGLETFVGWKQERKFG